VPARFAPPRPGVYPVRVDGAQRWARWTGDYWCNWGPDADRAARCEWRGPAAGFDWRPAA